VVLIVPSSRQQCTGDDDPTLALPQIAPGGVGAEFLALMGGIVAPCYGPVAARSPGGSIAAGFRRQATLVAIVVEVEECFGHCADAFVRSHLWESERWPMSRRPTPRRTRGCTELARRVG
jgi:hypothetical protein